MDKVNKYLFFINNSCAAEIKQGLSNSERMKPIMSKIYESLTGLIEQLGINISTKIEMLRFLIFKKTGYSGKFY